MELWPVASGPPAVPVLTVDGVLADDSRSVTFSRTAEQTTAAADDGPLRYRHRLLVHDPDPDVDDVRVLLRGYVTVGPPEAAP